MNIETPTMNKTAQITEIPQSVQSSSTVQRSDDKKSFTEELNSVKQESDKVEQTQVPEENLHETDKKAEPDSNTVTKEVVSKTDKTDSKKELKDEKSDKSSLASNVVAHNVMQPLNELRKEILNMSGIKENKNISALSKAQKFSEIDKVVDFKSIKIDKNDAMFFANLVKNEQLQQKDGISNSMNMSDLSSESIKNSIKVSATLMDALKDSLNTNKPFRVDFDNNIAVIMKVDKTGKLSADFIPGDAAVENYLRNNIPSLKQSFDSQDLPYSSLTYRKHREQQQNNNNQDKKENSDE